MTMPEDAQYKIALILDGVVEQILYSNQSDAAKFLSNPTFEEIPDGEVVTIGATFDGASFTPPTNPPELPELLAPEDFPTITEIIEGELIEPNLPEEDVVISEPEISQEEVLVSEPEAIVS